MSEQREWVEQSLVTEPGRAATRWPRHLYEYEGLEAAAVEPGMFVSTQPGAYWQVISVQHVGLIFTFLLNEVRPTDPRTHNGNTTALYGGQLT